MDLQKIVELIEKKEYKQAKELILESSEEEQKDTEVQKYLGLCNINLGCFHEAATSF